MGDTLIISGIFKALIKYFWVLVITMLIGGAIGRSLTPAGPPPEYKTNALVLLEREEKLGEGISSQDDVVRFITTAQTLVKTPVILEKVQAKMGTTEDVRSLYGRLDVQIENNSMIIRIDGIDTDANRVTQLVNTTAQVFCEEVGNYLNVKSAVIVSSAVAGHETQILHTRTNANMVMGIIIGFVVGTLIVFLLNLLKKRKLA